MFDNFLFVILFDDSLSGIGSKGMGTISGEINLQFSFFTSPFIGGQLLQKRMCSYSISDQDDLSDQDPHFKFYQLFSENVHGSQVPMLSLRDEMVESLQHFLVQTDCYGKNN